MFEDNKLVVRKWLALVQGDEGDIRASQGFMDDAINWTLIGSTPISGTFHGLVAVNDGFHAKCWNGDGRPGSSDQGLDPAYGIKPLRVRDLLALEDGRILVHCHSDAMGRNGVAYKNEYCWLFTLAAGKIIALYEFADTALIERAIFNKRIVAAEDQIEPG